MKKINKGELTKVLYLSEFNGFNVLAVFPDLIEGKNKVLCYKQFEQHSNCTVDYYKNLPQASPLEYGKLHEELIGLGYQLKILNDAQQGPIQTAITGLKDGRTFIIYHDGGVKIIDQGPDYNSHAIVISIGPDEMQLILNALKAR